MTNATADCLASISLMQTALTVLNTLQLTAYAYPSNCTITNGDTYDYIIVGAGTAGSVLGYRLSTNSSNRVLLIETGGYPPFESTMAGMFTPMPMASYDYGTCSVNDYYTAQNLQGKTVSLTQGRTLGGSSSVEHMIWVQGDPHDYNNWASILGDNSWSYENVLTDFKKVENLTDSDLVTTDYADLHGLNGMVKIKRQIEDENQYYLDAFAEAGWATVNDTTSLTSSLGATNPLFSIDDNVRQSSSYCYLTRAKNRPNLCVALSTKATKILFENSTAVGVQVITSSGTTLEVYANKEVIVSAGAIYSSQLLMLSGIGPKEHLESHNISVVADLPVGQCLMDHPSAVLLIQMESDTSVTPPSNPFVFPVPTTTLYAALNSSQTYPDYQTISLLFPHDSSAMMQLCANCFKYSDKICDKFNAANVGKKVLFVVHNLMMPKSCGNVTLASTDHNVEPLVYTGTYSNNDDLPLMTHCLEDFLKVLNTTYFTENNATLVDTGLCPGLNGTEFLECYAMEMSATMWHYSGTCAMGSVTDSEMLVKNVTKLRVVDASVMPTLVSGNIKAAVTMIGERGSALILGQ